MFGWVARLFPSLRVENEILSAQLAAAQADVTSARDEMEVLRQERDAMSESLAIALKDKDRLWEMAEKALAAERFANHTAYNHEVQRHGGGIPYPEAHSLPPNIVPPVQKSGPIGRSGRILTSQAMMQQSRVALAEYMNREE